MSAPWTVNKTHVVNVFLYIISFFYKLRDQVYFLSTDHLKSCLLQSGYLTDFSFFRFLSEIRIRFL